MKGLTGASGGVMLASLGTSLGPPMLGLQGPWGTSVPPGEPPLPEPPVPASVPPPPPPGGSVSLASGVLLPPQAGRLRARSTPESTAPENTAFEDAAFENTAFDDGEEPSSVRARGPPAPRRPAGREGRGRRAGDFFMGEWSARGE